VTAIGKLEPTTGMLIPNQRYFEMFGQAAHPEPQVSEAESVIPTSDVSTNRHALPVRVACYGISYALHRMASDIGLIGILSKCLPEHHAQVLGLASYILAEGNAMMYLQDWFDETEVFFTRRLDDRNCSQVYRTLTHGTQSLFFSEWLSYRRECEYLAYDVTSISTHARGIDFAEWGYNRDGDQLPQVNLAMFVGAQSGLPVCYSLYNGSISDKSRFENTLETMSKLGMTNSRLVFDRGFVAADNMKFLNDRQCLFATAMPLELVEARRLVDAVKNSIQCAANRLDEQKVFATSCDSIVYGFKMKAHVYYDPEKRVADEEALFARVTRLRDELEKMARTKRATKKYTDLFDIQQDEAGISFSQSNERIDEILGRTGHFVLLTNDERLSSAEVLSIYRGRDVIEKSFEQLKNDLDFRRLRTHGNQTTDAKMFLGFVALILRSHLQKKIKGDAATKRLTVDKVLRELRKIKLVEFQDRSRKVMTLTKLQKTILAAIGIQPNELIESVA